MSENASRPISVRSLLDLGIWIALSILLAWSASLWDSNRALRMQLDDEVRRSAQAEDSSNNYVYLLDRYPNATRTETYVERTIRMSTREATRLWLPVRWREQQCSLQVDATGIISSETAFIKPRLVVCGASETRVNGIVFAANARMVRGQLITANTPEGQVIPMIELPAKTKLEPWIQVEGLQ